MTLEELFKICMADRSRCKSYIKKYETIRETERNRILSLKWSDISCNEEVNKTTAPRTKGVVVGLIHQSMLSNSEKLKKIEEIITNLKEFL